jgi:hypothetical protein
MASHRIATFAVHGSQKYGAVVEGGIVDLSARFGKEYPTLREAIAAGALTKLGEDAARRSPDHALDAITWQQDDRTGRLMFGFRYLINYISTFTTLVPGDVIVTGTPTGAGARFDPPRYLKPGDVVEVEADNIGMLRNGVIDEAP